MKLFKILCILTLVLLPLGEIFRIDLGNNIAIRPLDVIVGISATCFAFYCFKYKKLGRFYLHKPIIGFIIICLISLLVNISIFSFSKIVTASLYLIRWISYSLIFVIILGLDKIFIHKIAKGLLLGGVTIQIFGYIQYFLYPNLRNLYYLGWDEHNYRMFSVFFDPNFAGAFFVLFLLFTSGLIHKGLMEKNYKQSVLLGIILALTLSSIFLTYSRSALLMLLIGVSTYLVLIGRRKLIFVFLGVIFSVIILLVPSYNKENTNLLRVTSSLARVDSYVDSLKIIGEHPIFGIGFNTYRYAQQYYGFRSEKPQYQNHADAGVDNSFLFILATTGIVGFSAYLSIWFFVLKRMFVLRKNKNNIIANVVVASICGLFINSLFINSLFYVTIMLWMWILIASAEKY